MHLFRYVRTHICMLFLIHSVYKQIKRIHLTVSKVFVGVHAYACEILTCISDIQQNTHVHIYTLRPSPPTVMPSPATLMPSLAVFKLFPTFPNNRQNTLIAASTALAVSNRGSLTNSGSAMRHWRLHICVVCAYVCACVYVFTHICMYVYMYVCVCVCVCVCV